MRSKSKGLRAIRHRDSGFTVLELLISLALLGLIMSYLFGAISFGKRAWEEGERVDDLEAVDLVQKFIERRLAKARTLVVTSEGGAGAELAFEGASDGVRFVAALPGRTEIAGVYEIEIAKQPGDADCTDCGSLAVRQSLFRPDATAFDGGDENRTLLRHVRAVEFRFFGSPNPHLAPAWHDQWIGHQVLPRLVNVRVEFHPGDRRRWRDLVVELKLAGSR